MSELKCYILAPDGQTPVEASPREWANWFADVRWARRVAYDSLPWRDGARIVVSTVFVGVEHRIDARAPLRLFETLVSGGPVDGLTAHHQTWAEAEASHRRIVLDLIGAFNAGNDDVRPR